MWFTRAVLLAILTLQRPEMPWSLPYAAARGQLDLIAMLLKLGADPNGTTRDANTALHQAALKGNLAIVRLLLEHGADPNRPGANGQLPIHDAALANHPAIVTELLRHGANPNPRLNGTGPTPREIAIQWNHPEVLKALDTAN